jgi:HSP20 family protein
MAMELWDPFAEAISLRDAMDRLLQESFIRPSGASSQRGLQQQQAAMLPLDVKESEDGYTIQASLPGIKPEDVQIQIMGDTVTIRGETREDREEKRGEQVIMRERRMGRFARAFTLPLPVDADHAEANFENGVLTLRLPKAQQAKPRRIQVRSGDGQQEKQDQAAVQGAAESIQGRG